MRHQRLPGTQWSPLFLSLCCMLSIPELAVPQSATAQRYPSQPRPEPQRRVAARGRSGQQHRATCADRHPWIEPALDEWFQLSWSRPLVGLSLEAVLDQMRQHKWSNHNPGKEEVTLTWDLLPGSKIFMNTRQVFPPNDNQKPKLMLDLLRTAVDKYQEEIKAALGSMNNITFFIQTEDFPLQHPGHAGPDPNTMRKWVLPMFSMCSSPKSSDVPVPDFTFVKYDKLGQSEQLWGHEKIQVGAGNGLPWPDRLPAFSWRGQVAAGGHPGGARQRALELLRDHPAFQELYQELNITFDAVDAHSGNPDSFLTVDEICQRRYLLHLRGFTYSASLRYQLLCGSPVAAVLGRCWQFYQPALAHGKHYLVLQEPLESHVADNVALLRELMMGDAASADRAQRIGKAGRQFVLEELTPDSVSCYWSRAIVRYGRRFAQLAVRGPVAGRLSHSWQGSRAGRRRAWRPAM